MDISLDPREGSAAFKARPWSASGYRGLFAVLAFGFAIRLYLSLSNYCISGDGVAYLGMARAFAARDWQAAFGSVFSPLYPGLIALAHRVIPDWELAGNFVSLLTGSGAIATVYLMTREAFARNDLALGAAGLTAIHPELAGYSASVRTEAGYILLMTASTWLLLKGTREQRLRVVAIAGAVGGFAYLYRTEGVGLLLFVIMFVPVAASMWQRELFGRAIMAASAFAVAFVIIAAPYPVIVHATTGHWAVSREFTAAMMNGMGRASTNGEVWWRLEFSANVSPLAPLLTDPKLYIEKIAGDFVRSFYGFEQALGPILTALLAVGLWARRDKIFVSFAETFIALLVVFFFCGFAFARTGARLMVHLIPFTFGWVMLGFEICSDALARAASTHGWHLPQSALAIIIAFILLPRTLWPIGYDMRGIREAGKAIARRAPKPAAVAARDGRVAYYAGARFFLLPTEPTGNLCSWLEKRSEVGYVLADDHDELRLGASTLHCLGFLKRYHRYGTHYYDLYIVRAPRRDVPTSGK